MAISKKIKGSWKSLTIWLNGVLLAMFPMIDPIKESLPQLGQYMTPTMFKWLGLSVVVMNIALRFKTTKSLGEK